MTTKYEKIIFLYIFFLSLVFSRTKHNLSEFPGIQLTALFIYGAKT